MNSISPGSPLLRLPPHAQPESARRPRGVVLLLVLVYIVLALGLLTLITASASQLSRVHRHEGTALILRQMIDSGHAWALVHQNDNMDSGAVTLDAQQLLPAAASGTVTVITTRDPSNERPIFTLSAELSTPDRTVTSSATFAHPAWDSLPK